MPKNLLFTRVNGPWVALLTLVLVVTVLALAKEVLLPLALGIVLAFTLTPLVRFFDRCHFPRALGVTLTMLIALSLVGGVGYVVFDQFSDLSSQVTKYTSSMRRKVSELRMGNDAALRQLTRTVDRVTEQLDENAADLRLAQPVRVVPPRATPVERLRDVATSVFEPIASAVIVLVLVAFMLGQREDLRDRFIRLIGADNVNMTTRLMDEAGHRVSQFLLWQTLINIGFGALIALGLYWIGVPYAALWGGLTALLRFVPYVGSMLAALMPAALAFATFPGISETLQTIALFLGLDLVTAYFIEPLVFGQRTGVSSFALLMSALFWIWVWGPVGLLLATPLTVCIAVLGRHVRSLRFLAIIFADEPALTPHVRFYQRLLARDDNEANVLIERTCRELGVVGVMDHVLIPALALVLQHRSQNEISEEDAQFILDETVDVVQQMAPEETEPAPHAYRIAGMAAHTEVDHLVLEMLAAAIAPMSMDTIPHELPAEEAIGRVSGSKPSLVCVAAISPTRGSEVRTYCRRLRGLLPEAKLLVLRPHLADADVSRATARMKEAGADFVATSVAEAVDAITSLCGQAGSTPPARGAEQGRGRLVAAAR